MKTKKHLIILIIIVMCLSLLGCSSLLPENYTADNSTAVSSSAEIKESEKTDGKSSTKAGRDADYSKTNVQDKYSFLDADSTKDESINAEMVFELIVNDDGPKRNSSFASLGYDVTAEDALLYAKSSALMGDSTNEYKMLEYLGYEIDKDNLAKAENYSKAKTLIREGNHTEAFQLLCKDLDYADSKKLAEEMVNQKLVNFRVGDIGPAGGYIFYDKGSYSDGWRFLEAAPVDLSEKYEYGGWGIKIGNTSKAVGTGKANTEAIVKKLGSGTYAAKACSDYTYNGYSDWFLPSKEELNLMYENLHKQGLSSFANYYWSSSEDNGSNAWRQNFVNGNQGNYDRNGNNRVRPIRAF